MVRNKYCKGNYPRIRIGVEIVALAFILLTGGAGAATLTGSAIGAGGGGGAAGGAGAAALTVDDSGGANFTRIQDAIDNASAGDTIQVYSGTYYENVDVNKPLTLRGADNGGGKPVVDANGSGSAITLSAGNSTLEGFTAANASYSEAGIRVISNNNMLINNTAINNNYYGFSLFFSSNNTLVGNNALNNGYSGISLISSGNNKLSDNIALNSDFGPGIVLSHSNNNTLSSNNASYNSGDGISLGSSSNNTLIGNNASNNSGNGISLGFSSDNVLNDNNASNNNGNGIFLSSSSNNRLINNMMTGNSLNFGLAGDDDSHFDNQIETSNLVDGKPIYYIKGAANTVYDSSTNAGTFYCIDCLNVTIKDLDLNINGSGVIFWNTACSRIHNVNASKGIGIVLSSSSNNTLSDNIAAIRIDSPGFFKRISSNNTLSGNNAYGISLDFSDDNTLNYNNAYGNGISLIFSSNNTLIGNNASNNNGGGISLFISSNNTLIDNIASNNSNVGISLILSSNSMLSSNVMAGNKFNFDLAGNQDSHVDNQIDISNLVEGKSIYYIKGAANTVYDASANAGTFYCINCINVTIKDMNLNTNGAGIFFWNTSHSRIQNVNASNNLYGIRLESSSNNILIGNDASNNNGDGIYIIGSHSFFAPVSSDNMLISNNASNNNGNGISLSSLVPCGLPTIACTNNNNNTLIGNNASNNRVAGITLQYYNDNNMLIDNYASNNSVGIYLLSSSNNTLRGNNASNNNGDGISLSYFSNNNMLIDNYASNNNNLNVDAFSFFNNGGIVLSSSSNNTLRGNIASNNGGEGIGLDSSSNNNTLSSNIASNNHFGITISSSGNRIYHNNFINNTNQTSDSTSTNSWDNGYPSGGNFWSDHTAADIKNGVNQDMPGSDGIGDAPYNISGAGAKDRYPFIRMNGWLSTPTHACRGYEYIIHKYAGGDCLLGRTDAVRAVIDYFDGRITKPEAINVVIAYFSR